MGAGSGRGEWLSSVSDLLKPLPNFQTIKSSFAKVITDEKHLIYLLK